MTKNKLLAENLRGVLDATAARLSPLSDTPQLDAEVLVAHILNKPRTWLLAHDDSSFDPNQAEALESLTQRPRARRTASLCAWSLGILSPRL